MTVVLRETGALIVNCGIRRKLDNDWEADIGYEIAPKSRVCHRDREVDD